MKTYTITLTEADLEVLIETFRSVDSNFERMTARAQRKPADIAERRLARITQRRDAFEALIDKMENAVGMSLA